MRRLIKIWWHVSKMVILPDLFQPAAAILFIIGKVVRFAFYFIFIFSIVGSTNGLLEYTKQQVILFFLIFNLLDIIIQFVFRGVYHFRGLVVSGNFDLELLKPLPSFFRPLLGHLDIMDFITLIPMMFFIIFYVLKNNLVSNFENLFMFFVLFISSFVLGFAYHLLVCSMTIRTLQIDHLVWVYRDLTSMARFPIDVYRKAVRFFLTFVFPVALLITFPAKGLLGLLSWNKIILTLVVSLFTAVLSIKFWYQSLKLYSSASS